MQVGDALQRVGVELQCLRVRILDNEMDIRRHHIGVDAAAASGHKAEEIAGVCLAVAVLVLYRSLIMLSWVSSVQSPFLTVSYISGSLRDSISVRLYSVRKNVPEHGDGGGAACQILLPLGGEGDKVVEALRPVAFGGVDVVHGGQVLIVTAQGRGSRHGRFR